MARIRAKGIVLYPPGPWGQSVPASGASVEIIDKDISGGDDVIWTGTTDARGNFEGLTNDWQDTISTRVWVVDRAFPPPPQGHWENRTIPDPTDIRALVAKITLGSCSQILPFPYISDNAPPIPLVLLPSPTCRPPRVMIGKVNGVPVYIDNQNEVHVQIKNQAEAGVGEIKIEIYGPFAQALEPITRSKDELRKWVLERQGLGVNSIVLQPNPEPWLVLACLIVVALVVIALFLPGAIAGSIFVSCLAIGVLLAIILGYEDILAGYCGEIDIPFDGSNARQEYCVGIVLRKFLQRPQ